MHNLTLIYFFISLFSIRSFFAWLYFRTGVIGCCCWKNKDESSEKRVLEENLITDQNLFNSLASRLSILKEKQQNTLSIGDVLHVRGKIKTFRYKKEISASYFTLIEDPNTLVARMCELPQIYRKFYDILFKVPQKIQMEMEEIVEEKATGTWNKSKITQMLLKVLDLFEQGRISQTFSLEELNKFEELVQISQMPFEESREINPNSTHNPTSFSQQIRELFKIVVDQLEEQGKVYRTSESKSPIDSRYHFNTKENSLENTVVRILKKESNRLNGQNGCHISHILRAIKSTKHLSRVNKEVVLKLLEQLENESVIISTTKQCYLLIS